MYDVLEKAPDTVLPATETRILPAVRWRLGVMSLALLARQSESAC